MTYWLLVADAAHARVISSGPHLSELKVVREIENTHGRERYAEVNPNDMGTSPAAAAGRRRTPTDPQSSARGFDQRRFANELRDLLASGLHRNEYEKLAIVAPPEFLGVLKSALPQRVHDSTVETMPKNLTRVQLRDLPDYLSGISLPAITDGA